MRRDAFAPGWALRARIAAASVLALALVAGVAVALVWLVVAVKGGHQIALVVIVIAFSGLLPATSARRARRAGGAVQRRVEEAVARLSQLADRPAPEVRVHDERVPLSWTTVIPHPRVHVTTGLVDRLAPRELDAVLAHELSHIANRDAFLMSVVSAPGIGVLRGLRAAIADGGLRDRAVALALGAVLVPPALAFAWLARVVSRHRELVADRGAALLTGSPAAVAGALVAVSDGLERQRAEDLRAVALRDSLHFVPAQRTPPRRLARLWATHPPLAARLAQLDAIEARLHGS